MKYLILLCILTLSWSTFVDSSLPAGDPNSLENAPPATSPSQNHALQHSQPPTLPPHSPHTDAPAHQPTDSAPKALPSREGSEEKDRSWQIWFILMTLVTGTLLIYLMLRLKLKFVPESICVVFLGTVIGLLLKFTSGSSWVNAETFPSTIFFLFLLPLIIFESGYSLHKGNFFRNIGSVMVFSVFGTLLSTIVIGIGVYVLGRGGYCYRLSFIHSLAFGSLISAVDPVATLAVFKALDVDPDLNMLVFGESVLNDAVSIVLTRTLLEFADPAIETDFHYVCKAFGNFFLMFLGSALIGILSALTGTLILKHVSFRNAPSLEFALVCIFGYSPYFLAEGLQLSGIMAILFCGIVMAHYAHFNLSPTSQITTQQTFRMMAFLAETCVFVYLGLALFSYELSFQPSFVVYSIVLCLLGRAVNIFPLSAIVNKYRTVKITPRFQFIMWYSGLRGAIAFALSLHLSNPPFLSGEIRVIVTTTLIIVLFTILVLGGTTMPLLKFVGVSAASAQNVLLSKTEGIGKTLDPQDSDEELYGYSNSRFEMLDRRYFKPFFRRRITRQEMDDAQLELRQLTSQWYTRIATHDGEDSNSDTETGFPHDHAADGESARALSWPNLRLAADLQASRVPAQNLLVPEIELDSDRCNISSEWLPPTLFDDSLIG